MRALIIFFFVFLNHGFAVNLYVCAWDYYFPQKILDKFEKKYNIHVVFDIVDSQELIDAKVLSKCCNYDIVAVTAFPNLEADIDREMYLPIRSHLIPNLKNISPELCQKLTQKQLDYAVPYIYGLSGIGVNSHLIQKAEIKEKDMQSLGLLFDPKIVKRLSENGDVTLMDSYTEVFPAALQYLGLNPNSISQDDLDAAYRCLIKIRPYIRGFDSAYNEKLIADKYIVSQGLSDLISIASRDSKGKIKFINPVQGSFYWADLLAIPTGAKHPVEAHQFLNFLLEPENMAEISQSTMASNFVANSIHYIDDKETLAAVCISENDLNRAEIDQYLGEKAEKERRRLWSRFKSGVDA